MLKRYFTVVDLLVYIVIFFFFNIIGSVIGHKLITSYGYMYGVENMTKLSYIPTFVMIVLFSYIYRSVRCRITESPCRFVGNGHLSPNSVLLGVLLIIAVSIVIDPLSTYFEEDMAKYIKIFTTGNMWVTLFVTVLAAPILEELFFRGIILRDISVCWGPRCAIVISSLLFSLLHLNLIQAIPAFLMGLAMGYIYVLTRRGLTNAICVHIINNLMASVSLFWGFGEISVWERYLPNEIWYKIIYGLSALIVLLLIARIATLSGKSLINLKKKNG